MAGERNGGAGAPPASVAVLRPSDIPKGSRTARGCSGLRDPLTLSARLSCTRPLVFR